MATTNVVDLDGDGVAPIEELSAGTDLLVADTDEDGLDDDVEIDGETDPVATDTDADGLLDGPEVSAYDTDPTAADTDGDGLDDGREVDELGTAPRDDDTDDDGLADGAEATEHGTDPLAADTDEDGLDDGAEVNDHGTDPLLADTDGDGLGDEREVDGETDPLVADTDDDGLGDGREFDRETDPLDADTDGDGLADGAEVDEWDSDPLDPDTDGDGVPDGPEATSDRYPGDPVVMDVYVEVDRMDGVDFGPDDVGPIERGFADAPIENRDGSTGMGIHFLFDEGLPERSSFEGRSGGDAHDLFETRFDNRGYGYRYMIVVGDIDDCSCTGVATRERLQGDNDAIVMVTKEYDHTANTAMHELGHGLGLTDEVHDGIDSFEYAYEAYPSVLNYNRDRDTDFTFSSGGASPDDFDEWGYIEANVDLPPVGEIDVPADSW